MNTEHDKPAAAFEDDADTPRPRWVGVVLAVCVALLVVGLLMTSVFIMRNYALTDSAPAAGSTQGAEPAAPR